MEIREGGDPERPEVGRPARDRHAALARHHPPGLDADRPDREREGRGQQGRQDEAGGPPPGPRQRYSRKKARSSVASASGSSIAAKWPPAGITVQRRMSYMRSAQARGGRTISFGNAA